MARLKVVASGDPDAEQRELSMAEAAQEALKECLAEHPSALFLVWEAPRGKISNRVLPNSVMLQKGFVQTLYEIMFEDGGVEDEPS